MARTKDGIGTMKSIEVVGAVIVSGGRVLCAQRGGSGPLSGLWEFPGGKIEPGEAPGAALTREIYEELRCHITVGDQVTTTRHDYEFATVTLTTFYCSLTDGHPSLTEHIDMRWLAPDELRTLEWAPADIPAMALVEKRLTGIET